MKTEMLDFLHGSDQRVTLGRGDDDVLWVWFHWTDEAGKAQCQYVCAGKDAKVQIEHPDFIARTEIKVPARKAERRPLPRRRAKAYIPDGRAYP